MHREQRPVTEHRRDLAGEHHIGDAGQLILAILFAIVYVADSFILNWTTFLNDVAPNVVRAPIGVALLVVAAYLAKTGLDTVFGQVREEPHVIRTGVFALVRHPIYLSEVLLYLGMLMLSVSLAAAVVWLGSIAFLHYIALHEERLLLARFGDEYAAYMRDVPMWLPRFSALKRREGGDGS